MDRHTIGFCSTTMAAAVFLQTPIYHIYLLFHLGRLRRCASPPDASCQKKSKVPGNTSNLIDIIHSREEKELGSQPVFELYGRIL